MLPVIVAFMYFISSAVVIVLMKAETNKRLKSSQPEDISCAHNSPYVPSPAMLVVFVGIIIASAFTGYTVAKRAISPIALIELSVCYMAVLAAAVIDLKTQTIPNFIPITLIIVRLLIFVYELCFENSSISFFVSSLIGCLLCALLLIIANKVSKGGIGGGDIKLLSSIGFVCGLYVVFSTMLLALLCCIVISAVLLAMKKCSTKDQLPFGPYIYIGYLIVCLLTLY